jgi:methanogenic corrinoid protein MtbC1
MRDLSSPAEPLLSYDHALAEGDTAAVTRLVQDMLAAGAEPVSLLVDVIAAAQREVGRRWQRGEWTVAQEHAATAVAIAATKLVADHVRQYPLTRGKVLVACAEREWHALPAMIIDCAFRAAGWDTTLLGASTSPLRLNQHLQDIGPDAVAVSCSVLGSLPTCRRFIEASTAVGVPILVGGPAFGPDDVRARALGATAWAPDAHTAITVLQTLPAVVEPAAPLPDQAAAEQAALSEDHRRLVALMREQWSLASSVTTSEADRLQSVMEIADDALHQLLHAVSAVLLTGDHRPIAETAAWVADLIRSRGGDEMMLTELTGVLGVALREHPLANQLIIEHFTFS